MKEVVRCKHCRLNQFMTIDKHCRKCRESFTPVVVPVAAPVVAPVVVADPDVSIFKASPTNFARVFTVCRHTMGWTQREMEKRLKVPRTYISKLENGRSRPGLVSLFRWADAFKVTPAFLCMMAEGQDD